MIKFYIKRVVKVKYVDNCHKILEKIVVKDKYVNNNHKILHKIVKEYIYKRGTKYIFNM